MKTILRKVFLENWKRKVLFLVLSILLLAYLFLQFFAWCAGGCYGSQADPLVYVARPIYIAAFLILLMGFFRSYFLWIVAAFLLVLSQNYQVQYLFFKYNRFSSEVLTRLIPFWYFSLVLLFLVLIVVFLNKKVSRLSKNKEEFVVVLLLFSLPVVSVLNDSLYSEAKKYVEYKKSEQISVDFSKCVYEEDDEVEVSLLGDYDCLKDYFIYSKQPELCSNLNNDAAISDCFLRYYVYYEMFEKCSTISEQTMKSLCFHRGRISWRAKKYAEIFLIKNKEEYKDEMSEKKVKFGTKKAHLDELKYDNNNTVKKVESEVIPSSGHLTEKDELEYEYLPGKWILKSDPRGVVEIGDGYWKEYYDNEVINEYHFTIQFRHLLFEVPVGEDDFESESYRLLVLDEDYLKVEDTSDGNILEYDKE